VKELRRRDRVPLSRSIRQKKTRSGLAGAGFSVFGPSGSTSSRDPAPPYEQQQANQSQVEQESRRDRRGRGCERRFVTSCVAVGHASLLFEKGKKGSRKKRSLQGTGALKAVNTGPDGSIAFARLSMRVPHSPRIR
jgi:hypothetical protein